MEPRHLVGAAVELEEVISLRASGDWDSTEEEWLPLDPGMRFAAQYLRDIADGEAYELDKDAAGRKDLLATEEADLRKAQETADIYWGAAADALLEEYNAHAGSGGWVVAEGQHNTTVRWLADLRQLAEAYPTPEPKRTVLPVGPHPVGRAEVLHHIREKVVPRAVRSQRLELETEARERIGAELKAVLADAGKFGLTLADLLTEAAAPQTMPTHPTQEDRVKL